MARKKVEAPRPKESSPNGLVIRCLPEWRAWLKAIAEAEQSSMSEVINRALMDYARKIGIKEPAPRRTEG